MKYILTMLAVVGCVCSTGKGELPAEQPVPGWDQQVAAIAAAVVNSDPAPAAIMFDGTTLRPFDPEASSSVAALLDRTSGGTVIFWRIYSGVPTALAGDMAEDVNAADLPEPLRRQFTPPGMAALRDANAVAGDWIRDTLAPRDDQPVAVIVIWRNGSALPSLTAANYTRDITFVLMTGEKDSATGKSVIGEIVFGNPVQGQ